MSPIYVTLASEEDKIAVIRSARSSDKRASEFCRDVVLSAMDFLSDEELIALDKSSKRGDRRVGIMFNSEQKDALRKRAKELNTKTATMCRSIIMKQLKEVTNHD